MIKIISNIISNKIKRQDIIIYENTKFCQHVEHS